MKFLGGLSIQQNGAPLPELKSQKGKALLCYLAVTRKHVSRSALAGLFWSDMPESGALMNLRKVLNRLKPLSHNLLITRETVAFNLAASHWLDVVEFEEQVAATSNPVQLQNAAALYQGDFLDGFTLAGAPLFDEWMMAQRARLREMAIKVLHKLVAYFREQGGDEIAIAYAHQILTIEPWDEETHRELMCLLALSGQRSAALAQYESCCRLLTEELGVAPADATVQLYEQIKAGKLVRESEGQEGRGVSFPPHNLPPQMTPFVGREEELARLQQLLAEPDIHLITIMGPGGMGKTRLALALAAKQLNGQQQPHPFAHGVYFVSLARMETADLLLPAIAEAIHLRFAEGDNQQEQLLRYLAPKAMLLVLDNFEHLLTGAGLVDEILQTAPQVKIVITSRIKMNLQVEQLFPIGGMTYPQVKGMASGDSPLELSHYSAVQLFLQCARRLRPDFELRADNQPHVLKICQLLEGMPLGIVLAASWLESLSSRAISHEIQQDIDFLATDMGDVPARQRSLRAAFNHSWRLLSEREQAIYCQLSIFRGGFTRAAAQAVTGATLRDLQALVNKSLLTLSPERRYDVHELLRQFAAEKLGEMVDLEPTVRDRHSAYYCSLLQQHTPNWYNARQLDALAEMTHEADNVQSAWRWALRQGAWQRLHEAIDSWGWYHTWRGLHADGETFCHTVCASVEGWVTTKGEDAADGYHLWAKAMVWYGKFAMPVKVAAQRFQQGLALLARPELAGEDTRRVEAFAFLCLGDRLGELDRQKARSYLEQSLLLFEALGDVWGVAKVLGRLGYLDWSAGDYALSQKRVQASLDILQEQGDRWGQIPSITMLAWVSQHLGQLAKAEQLRHQALDLCQQLGDRSTVANCTASLAYTVFWQGRFDEGKEWGEKSLKLSLEDGDLPNVGFAYLAIGLNLLFAGQYKRAQQILTRSLALVSEVNNPGVEATVHYVLGCLALVEMAYDEAQASFGESLRLYGAVQGDAYTFLALSGLGFSTCCTGDLDQSRHYFVELLTTAIRLKDYLHLLVTLPGVALYLLRRGKVEQAIAVWAHLQCQPYVANSQWYKDVVGQVVEGAMAEFPPEIVDAAEARGRELDLWQVGNSLLIELTQPASETQAGQEPGKGVITCPRRNGTCFCSWSPER